MTFPILTIVGIGVIAVLSSFYEKSWSHNWEDVSVSIKDSVLKAEKYGYTGGIGPNGRAMKEFSDTRFWIMNNATENELLNLIKYPDGTVKAIGYEGLIRRNDFNEKADLITKSINDLDYKVYYSFGCQSFGIEISEYLVRYVLMIDNGVPPFRPELIVDYGLSKSEKDKILTEFHNRVQLNKTLTTSQFIFQ